MAQKYKRFEKYPVDEQITIVTRLMLAGHTNVTASEVLRTTPGVIAGFRNRHGIAARPPGTLVPEYVVPTDEDDEIIEEFPEASVSLPQEEEQKLPEEPLQFGEGDGLPKLAFSEAQQCIEPVSVSGKLYRCAYLHDKGSRYCRLHKK
jgi:hypothetical protein